jgi:hypothetical protein
MKRSVFLWITALGAALFAAVDVRQPDQVTAGEARALSRADRASFARRATGDPGRAGRCQASRRTSRWSGYTIREMSPSPRAS